MSEISKLYENAGAGLRKCSECDNFNIDCGYSNDCYPLFTAEKQLILLKRIIKSYTISISYSIDAYYIKARSKNSKDEHLEVNNYLDEGLASIIIDIWQDLTEEEKEAMRGILRA